MRIRDFIALWLTALSCSAQVGPIIAAQRPNVLPWNPSQLPSLGLWFRADRLVFQNTNGTTQAVPGDPVAYWGNLGNSGGTFAALLQGTNSLRPTLVLATNGQPALRFATNYLEAIMGAATQPYYAYVVARYGSAGGVGSTDGEFIVNPAFTWALGVVDSNRGLYFYDGAVYPAGAMPTYVSLIMLNAQVANSTVWLNTAVGTNGTFVSAAFSNPSIGGRRGAPGYYLNGDVYEVVFTDLALTLQQRTNIQNYARYRYALPYYP